MVPAHDQPSLSSWLHVSDSQAVSLWRVMGCTGILERLYPSTPNI